MYTTLWTNTYGTTVQQKSLPFQIGTLFENFGDFIQLGDNPYIGERFCHTAFSLYTYTSVVIVSSKMFWMLKFLPPNFCIVQYRNTLNNEQQQCKHQVYRKTLWVLNFMFVYHGILPVIFLFSGAKPLYSYIYYQVQVRGTSMVCNSMLFPIALLF